MGCETFQMLERINRLSEIALEFHGEDLGEAAAVEVIDSAFGLAELMDQIDEDQDSEGDETSS